MSYLFVLSREWLIQVIGSKLTKTLGFWLVESLGFALRTFISIWIGFNIVVASNNLFIQPLDSTSKLCWSIEKEGLIEED